MCHHPPDWIWERDVFNDNIKARVAVALFGHKHVQRIERVNNSLRIGAGAVHPDRREAPWAPRYNFIGICAKGTGSARELQVQVLSRLWNEEHKEFRSDRGKEGNEIEIHVLPLEEWSPPVPPPDKVAGTITVTSIGGASLVVRGRIMNPERRLTFRYFDLPYSRRMEIVQRLGLIEDEDESLREDERNKLYFQRAKAKGMLDSFWEEVESQHADGKPDENPFKPTDDKKT